MGAATDHFLTEGGGGLEVEEEQGSYGKLTKGYICNKYILSYESII